MRTSVLAVWILLLVSLCFVRIAQSNLVWDNRCGVDIGCLHDCDDGNCGFLVTWAYRPRQRAVVMTMSLANIDYYNQQWFALAFSDDEKMGNDSVIECVTDIALHYYASVRHSYNDNYYNVEIPTPQHGLRDMRGSVKDGVLRCEFTRRMDMGNDDKVFSLNTPMYMFVTHGFTYYDRKVRHDILPGPHISPDPVDLKQNLDINSNTVDYLVKIHGSLMIIAWLMFASSSIILARYFKQLWPMGRMCNRRVWYQLHKILMLLTACFVLVGFVLIWAHTKGLSKMRGHSTIQKAHPFIGVVVMALTFINPLMAFLRPRNGTVARPVFKYIHGFIGTTLYILAVLNSVLGMSLPKSKGHPAAFWLLVGFTLYHFVVEIFLGIYECFLTRTGLLSDYELKELAAMRRDSLTSFNKPPPGASVKTVVLCVHVIISVGIGIAAVALLWKK